MSEFQASNFKKENGGTPDLLGKTELTSPYFFVPPSGDTASRPQSCAAGTLRFNTDIGTLEVYRGDTIGWVQIQRRNGQYLGGTPSQVNSTISNYGTGTRGLMMGGSDSGATTRDEIEFITISTLGNTQDFGNLTGGTRQGCGFSNSTRALRVGGIDGSSHRDIIDFVTIASTGDATDFGDMPEVRLGFPSALANEVRGVVCLGESANPVGNMDDLDYVTISSTGNAVAFGESSYGAKQQSTAGGSTTRGIYGGGSPFTNAIDFITIMTTGNGTNFGDLTTTFGGGPRGQSSNATRMLMYGGSNPSSDHVNSITFLTIATLGNTVDFGDISSSAGKAFCSAMCSKTRGVYAGGRIAPNDASVNIIEFVEIATTGNTQDFGVMAQTTEGSFGVSSGHGGL